MKKKGIFILGITSDIGKALGEYYSLEGYSVIGTYRSKNSNYENLQKKGIKLIACDINNEDNIGKSIEEYRKLKIPWNIFVSCIGTMEPIGKFFANDFKNWKNSVITNSIAQLHYLHSIYPYRSKNNISQVVFFAGAGTNNSAPNYSAYCISKIFLIKMCELLNDENKDLNVFIIGPGWVRTKIHNQTLNHSLDAGGVYDKTVDFLNSGNVGTSYKDIYDCINWCIKQERNIVGGCNFSVVHDMWRDGGFELVEQLRNDSNKFKLRRFKNQE